MKRRGVTSPEHDECVELVSKKLGLEIVEIKGNSNIKGKYFPDAKNETTDYEVEVVPRREYIEKKMARWDSNRKKVLVLKINSFARENFDEIYISDKTKLVKIKYKD